MVTLYMSKKCSSCKKAKEWLEENNIDYKEINILKERLTKEEVKTIIRMTEDGTDEIISTRSNVYQQIGPELERMNLHQLYEVIIENPSILRRPLVLDDKRLVVGYNEEELRRFLPRKVRLLYFQDLERAVND